MIHRKKKKRKRGTQKSRRKGKPAGRSILQRKKQTDVGFTPPQRKEVTTMNIGTIVLRLKEDRIEAPKEDDQWVIRPDELGIDKVLGAGRVDLPIKLVLPPKCKVSRKAKQKIHENGGAIEEIQES